MSENLAWSSKGSTHPNSSEALLRAEKLLGAHLFLNMLEVSVQMN